MKKIFFLILSLSLFTACSGSKFNNSKKEYPTPTPSAIEESDNTPSEEEIEDQTTDDFIQEEEQVSDNIDDLILHSNPIIETEYDLFYSINRISEPAIFRMDKTYGKVERFYNLEWGNDFQGLIVDNILYYVDNYDFYSLDLNTGINEEILSNVGGEFLYYEDKFIFLSSKSIDLLDIKNRYPTSRLFRETLYDSSSLEVVYKDGNLYAVDAEQNNIIYKIPLNGDGITWTNNRLEGTHSTIHLANQTLYYSNTDGLYKTTLDSNSSTKINDTFIYIKQENAYDKYYYYTLDGAIYRLDLETGEEEKFITPPETNTSYLINGIYKDRLYYYKKIYDEENQKTTIYSNLHSIDLKE